ncbi:MAG: DUF4197 domain-containing protein [Alphaproteobacteria bacterium]|nr:DUF4197 domain-containing protein [Alphaproteobacteria bacterium]
MLPRRTLITLLAALPSTALAQFPSQPGLPTIPSIPGVPGPGQPLPPARSTGQGVTQQDAAGGLKDALRIGTERTVSRLGRAGGYLNDRDVRIGLPGTLGTVSQGLRAAGMGGMLDDLEQRMNRAAETAAPQGGRIFGDAIQRMSFQDAIQIVRGPSDAATQYFKRETTRPLTQSFTPVVDRELQGAGATAVFDQVMRQGRSVPLIGNQLGDTSLTGWVVEKALAGLFLYLGREEAAIRQNPAQRSTDLLRKVFG